MHWCPTTHSWCLYFSFFTQAPLTTQIPHYGYYMERLWMLVKGLKYLKIRRFIHSDLLPLRTLSLLLSDKCHIWQLNRNIGTVWSFAATTDSSWGDSGSSHGRHCINILHSMVTLTLMSKLLLWDKFFHKKALVLAAVHSFHFRIKLTHKTGYGLFSD